MSNAALLASVTDHASPATPANPDLGGVIVEWVLFGLYAVVYVVWAGILLYRNPGVRSKGRSFRDAVLFASSVAMFSLAVVHVGLSSYNLLGEPVGLQAELMTAFQVIIIVSENIIGDVFLTYRVYIVWGYSWMIAAPLVFLSVCQLALGYATALIPCIRGDMATAMAATRAYFLIALITNVLCTGAIVVRILSSRRMLRYSGLDPSRLSRRVVELLVQSAASFTAMSFCFSITAFLSPRGFRLCHHIFPSLVGIVFTLTLSRILFHDSDRTGELAYSETSESPSGTVGLEYDLDCHANSPCVPETPELDDVERRFCVTPIAIHVSISKMSDSDQVDAEEIPAPG